MESSCVQFLGNKTILITGAPGFLAKGTFFLHLDGFYL